jgi:hypothetical protein
MDGMGQSLFTLSAKPHLVIAGRNPETYYAPVSRGKPKHQLGDTRASFGAIKTGIAISWRVSACG